MIQSFFDFSAMPPPPLKDRSKRTHMLSSCAKQNTFTIIALRLTNNHNVVEQSSEVIKSQIKNAVPN